MSTTHRENRMGIDILLYLRDVSAKLNNALGHGRSLSATRKMRSSLALNVTSQKLSEDVAY